MSGSRRLSAVVLCGPSGAGKTTIAARMAAQQSARFRVSLSATTRKPRLGEVDGRDYVFVSRDGFDEMARNDRLAEWAEVHGEYYGTPAESLAPDAGDGRIAVLDIDVQGAYQVRERIPDVVVIFIIPPDPAQWLARLTDRGTESAKQIAQRLRTALGELEAATAFHEFVVNAEMDQATRDVIAIVEGEVRDRKSTAELHSLVQRLAAGAQSEIRRLEGPVRSPQKTRNVKLALSANAGLACQQEKS